MTDQNADFWRNEAQRNLTVATIVSGGSAQKSAAAAESVAIANSAARDAQRAAEDVHAENERYRALLARPLIEVLQENTDLKKAYKEQQKVLKDWIISQEAFRSLASRFRKELGVSDEKIKELVQEAEEKAPETLKARGIL